MARDRAGDPLPPELAITGALNWDINLFVKQIPRSGQEVVVEKIDRVPGGKGGNVAVAATRILGQGHVALIACLGKDDVGKKQISILKQEGVDTSTVQMLDQSVQSVLANIQRLVVIDPPRQVAGKLLAEGRRLRKSVIWHPGVLTRYGLSEFEDDMEEIDYLVLNEHEAPLFAGVKQLDQALSSLNKAAPKAKILVTLGSRGAAFYSAGKLSRIPRISLEKLGRKVVNTTGSGDAFVGAFAAYKVLGVSDMDAFRYANMAGALKACHPETRGSPTRKDLEDSYQKYFS